MDKKLEAKLVKKYPKLYQDYGGDPRKTCMTWGFECGDGWYRLIDKLSAKLKPHNVVAAQVKEKFGGLRFYINIIDEDIDAESVWNAIESAEEESYNICERCGRKGKLRKGMWWRTLCDECEEERVTTPIIKNIN